MIQCLTPEFTHSDERGTLTQLVSDGFKQVNIIFTKAGASRGRFHYHSQNIEAFYVISGELVLMTKTERLTFRSGDMFKIPPREGHSLKFFQDTLLISMYSQGVDLPDGTRDITEVV